MEIPYFPIFMVCLLIILAIPAYGDIMVDCWVACKKRHTDIQKEVENFNKYGV